MSERYLVLQSVQLDALEAAMMGGRRPAADIIFCPAVAAGNFHEENLFRAVADTARMLSLPVIPWVCILGSWTGRTTPDQVWRNPTRMVRAVNTVKKVCGFIPGVGEKMIWDFEPYDLDCSQPEAYPKWDADLDALWRPLVTLRVGRQIDIYPLAPTTEIWTVRAGTQTFVQPGLPLPPGRACVPGYRREALTTRPAGDHWIFVDCWTGAESGANRRQLIEEIFKA